MVDWKIFQGNQASADEKLAQLLAMEAPSWRQFSDSTKIPEDADEQTKRAAEEAAAQRAARRAADDDEYWQQLREKASARSRDIQRGKTFQLRVDMSAADSPTNPYERVIEAVNAALYLRRPLMITGRPGSGKTSLAYAIAHELALGPVLLWPVTTRSVLQDGLYQYDAIARLQDAQLSEQLSRLSTAAGLSNQSTQTALQKAADNFANIGQYIRLGPVGTAFWPSKYPRVLLIDEIDKSDINLPNDLLNLFEEGEFEIPELKRLAKSDVQPQSVESEDGIALEIPQGKVRCREFPLIIMTSNGEREFPPAFYRRCLRVPMPTPKEPALRAIVAAHLGKTNAAQFSDVIEDFVARQNQDAYASLPTDQLLNLIHLLANKPNQLTEPLNRNSLERLLFNPLNSGSEAEAEDADG